MKDEDQPRVKMAQLVRDLREKMPMEIELTQLLAKVTRAKYLALVGEGFSADEALLLCK